MGEQPVAPGREEGAGRQQHEPDRRAAEQPERRVPEQAEGAEQVGERPVARRVDLLPGVDLERVRVEELVVQQHAAGHRGEQQPEGEQRPPRPAGVPPPERQERAGDEDETHLEERQQEDREGDPRPLPEAPGAPRVEAEDAVEPHGQEERRRHLHPDLVGVEQERRRESDERPGREPLPRPLREVVAGQAQGHPGERRGERRHHRQRPAPAAQAIGGRQHQRQQLVVPRVDLAVRPHRVAGLRLDRPRHEVPPVLLPVVVGQVGVEVVGQAVGDEEIERLVAVRLAVARRPGEDREIGDERQQEEEDRRPAGQPLAEERTQRNDLPAQAVGEDEQEAGGEPRVGPGQGEVGTGEGQEHEQGDRRELARRPRRGEAPAAPRRRPAGDAAQGGDEERQEEEGAAERVVRRERRERGHRRTSTWCRTSSTSAGSAGRRSMRSSRTAPPAGDP